MPLPERTIPEDVLERMVTSLDPEWTLRSADLADVGTMPVYFCRVEMGEEVQDCVLKATPEEAQFGTETATEARLYALLDRHTSVPVPTVYGAVDAAEDLPAPYFLAAELDGDSLHLGETGRLSRTAHRRFARESGRLLASMHDVDAVDAYGYLGPAGPDPAGDPPRGDPGDVAVVDPSTDWPAVVEEWAVDALELAADSRFADLVPDLEVAIDERLRDVPETGGGTFPVLARVDHGVHNVLLDVETGATRGVLDLGFTLAATPAYDLDVVAENVAGGVWAFHPDVPDRRRAVRRWVRAGYAAAGGTVPAELDAAGDLYELLSLAREMGFFHQQLVEDTPDGAPTAETARDAAARALRTRIRSLR